MQEENNNARQNEEAALNDVWRELLGNSPKEPSQNVAEAAVLPLEADPWSALLRAKDVEVIDLQQLHLHMSDQDVEQALQVMQEQPVQNKNAPSESRD